MKARVHVSLKNGVLDPQGKAVADTLSRMGFDGVDTVRVGKVIDIDLEDGLSQDAAQSMVKDMCEKLLANVVVEKYEIEIE